MNEEELFSLLYKLEYRGACRVLRVEDVSPYWFKVKIIPAGAEEPIYLLCSYQKPYDSMGEEEFKQWIDRGLCNIERMEYYSSDNYHVVFAGVKVSPALDSCLHPAGLNLTLLGEDERPLGRWSFNYE